MRSLLIALFAALMLVSCRSALRDVRGLEALRAKADQLLPKHSGPLNTCQGQRPALDADACAAWLVRQDDLHQIQDGVRLALANADSAGESEASLLQASYGLGRLVDRVSAEQRNALSSLAVDVAQPCSLELDPTALCEYRLAQALGLQARERRSTALDALPRIIALLERVKQKDAALDHAGADRTLAWLYVRAPGWPTGPGDPDLALEHARAAVQRAPHYGPNLLALGESLEALDATADAAKAYRDALQQFSARPEQHLDLQEWLDDARGRLAGVE